ncbi:MAG: hypothetical protein MUE41_14840 [Gemmatimonadaceae bacterium]|nr:hypothetical protein [Gemmatimonadaceae bacterium]
MAAAATRRRFHYGRLDVWRERIAARRHDTAGALALPQQAVRAGYAMDALHHAPELHAVRNDPQLARLLAEPR